MDAAVGVVKAYLELSGYFVLAELPIREDGRSGYRDVTDLDIVAVRFPYRPGMRPAGPFELLLGADEALDTPDDALDVLIGEVKEGKAHLNPALRRSQTIAFALRRVGCCPEERVEQESRLITEGGRREMLMADGLRCVVRVVAFAGRGIQTAGADLTVPLGHCFGAMRARLHEHRDALPGARFKDPILELLALEEKLGIGGAGKTGATFAE